MKNRPSSFALFIRNFFHSVYYVRGVLLGLLGKLLLGGVAISYLEGLPVGRAIYFAFITGLSIGYGDITPQTGWGCVVSVLIGMIGMIFIGITVAVATRALSNTISEHSAHPE